MNKKLHSLFSLVVLAALVLAACTRSAGSAPVPTAVPDGSAGGAETTPDAGVPTMDATMAALGTQVSGSMTATAAVLAPVESTPVPEATQPPVVVDTPAPVATVAPIATPVPAVVTCANPYTVKEGDWIYKIARDCQLDAEAIIAANPGINPNRITPGQKLNLPTGGAPAPIPAACTGSYTVVQGDTLFRIAYGCGVTVEQLAKTNNIAYPYVLHIGDVIKFP